MQPPELKPPWYYKIPIAKAFSLRKAHWLQESSDLFMNVPLSDKKCQKCGVSSNGIMRGQKTRVPRFLGFLWKQPNYAIICHLCYGVIGYESPPKRTK